MRVPMPASHSRSQDAYVVPRRAVLKSAALRHAGLFSVSTGTPARPQSSRFLLLRPGIPAIAGIKGWAQRDCKKLIIRIAAKTQLWLTQAGPVKAG
jgi:hypothetical protein